MGNRLAARDNPRRKNASSPLFSHHVNIPSVSAADLIRASIRIIRFERRILSGEKRNKNGKTRENISEDRRGLIR